MIYLADGLLALGAYLLGSIPSGLVISRLARGVDIRQQGSGNIGTANVYRVAGTRAAAATLLFDALKGIVPVVLARALELPLWAVLLTGVAAVVGHNYSLLLRGHGGKGIATSIGVAVALAPEAAGLAVAIWALVLLGSRYASLASLLMMAALPLCLMLLGYPAAYPLFALGLGLLAVLRHRGNIGRLIHGTEVKITGPLKSRGS
jgi:glycerol-3-phosphate acyltransferase PlsY